MNLTTLIGDARVLQPNEEITLTGQQDEPVFVVQNGNWWRRRIIGPLVSIVPMDDKEVTDLYDKFIDEGKYDPEMIYIIQENAGIWDENELVMLMRYFREVYDKHKTEAGVILLFNRELNKWKIFHPLQVNTSGGRVTYLTPVSLEKYPLFKDQIEKDKEALALYQETVKEFNKLSNTGWVLAGTIHSHHNMAAYHSATDDHDESDFDGLHITIGKVRSGWDFSARYMIAGGSIKIENIKKLWPNIDDLTNRVDSVDFDEKLMNYLRIDINEPEPERGYLGRLENYFQNRNTTDEKNERWRDWNKWQKNKKSNRAYNLLDEHLWYDEDYKEPFGDDESDDDDIEEIDIDDADIVRKSDFVEVFHKPTEEVLLIRVEEFYDKRNTKYKNCELMYQNDDDIPSKEFLNDSGIE